MSRGRRTRRLIVNADDFGYSGEVNRGIIAAHQHGIVTSVSLMVRGAAAEEAAHYAREHPELSVGLHLDLGEWAFRCGGWRPLYEVVPPRDPDAVRGEVDRQLKAFHTLTGTEPTHLDSHQHVHRIEAVYAALADLARRLVVPLRGFTEGLRYCGAFYGQTAEGEPVPAAVSVDALVRILATLPTGTTELVCHPGEVAGGETMYREERALEVATLCHPRARAALVERGIELCAFHRLAFGRPAPLRIAGRLTRSSHRPAVFDLRP